MRATPGDQNHLRLPQTVRELWSAAELQNAWGLDIHNQDFKLTLAIKISGHDRSSQARQDWIHRVNSNPRPDRKYKSLGSAMPFHGLPILEEQPLILGSLGHFRPANPRGHLD